MHLIFAGWDLEHGKPQQSPRLETQKIHLLFVEASFLKVGQTWGMKTSRILPDFGCFLQLFSVAELDGMVKLGMVLARAVDS